MKIEKNKTKATQTTNKNKNRYYPNAHTPLTVQTMTLKLCSILVQSRSTKRHYMSYIVLLSRLQNTTQQYRNQFCKKSIIVINQLPFSLLMVVIWSGNLFFLLLYLHSFANMLLNGR